MLGKEEEEDIMCNLSSPIGIHLTGREEQKRYLFDSKSQKIKTNH
jgi:hypothetical protein